MNIDYAYGWVSIVAEQLYYSYYNREGYQYKAPVFELTNNKLDTRWLISSPRAWNAHMRFVFFNMVLMRGINFARRYMRVHGMYGPLDDVYEKILIEAVSVLPTIGSINTDLISYISGTSTLSYKDLILEHIGTPMSMDEIIDIYDQFNYSSITYIAIEDMLVSNHSC